MPKCSHHLHLQLIEQAITMNGVFKIEKVAKMSSKSIRLLFHVFRSHIIYLHEK